MARVNRPSIMVYGGTIQAGRSACQGGKQIDIVSGDFSNLLSQDLPFLTLLPSAFQAYGEFITGSIDEKTRFDIIRHACPGQGACGGMYTANTMATYVSLPSFYKPQ